MPYRTRIRSSGNSISRGTVNVPGSGTYDGYTGVGFYQETYDNSSGKGKENEFSTLKRTKSVEPLNGPVLLPSGAIRCTFSGYCPEGFSLYPTGGTPSGSDSSMVPRVLANSNPSRPYVDIGTFTGELRDFPSMGKDIWDTARRLYHSVGRSGSIQDRLGRAFKGAAMETFPKADQRFIAAQFGWLPFVGDIQKYLNSAEVIERRTAELQKLKQSGHSSRRVSLDQGTVVDSGIVSIASFPVTVKAGLTEVHQYSRWGVGKWYLQPTGRLSQASDIAQIRRLAKESVQGLVLDQSTAWNLMPWSWLIDWASNAGDWIDSTRNIVGASRSGSTSIMTTRIGLNTWKRDPSMDGFSKVTGGHCVHQVITKKRTIFSSTNLPEVTVPILTGRQSAILGSLMTMRAKRS